MNISTNEPEFGTLGFYYFIYLCSAHVSAFNVSFMRLIMVRFGLISKKPLATEDVLLFSFYFSRIYLQVFTLYGHVCMCFYVCTFIYMYVQSCIYTS